MSKTKKYAVGIGGYPMDPETFEQFEWGEFVTMYNEACEELQRLRELIGDLAPEHVFPDSKYVTLQCSRETLAEIMAIHGRLFEEEIERDDDVNPVELQQTIEDLRSSLEERGMVILDMLDTMDEFRAAMKSADEACRKFEPIKASIILTNALLPKKKDDDE